MERCDGRFGDWQFAIGDLAAGSGELFWNKSEQ
jgi:N-acetylglucosamine kinase-like BadF-type ATPase